MLRMRSAILSAEQLGITQKEYDALLLVRDALRDGQIAHLSGDDLDLQDSGLVPVGDRRFSMNLSGSSGECGTIACIGGWMSAVLQNNGSFPNTDSLICLRTMDDYVWYSKSHPLQRLFFPPEKSDCNYDRITMDDAVAAMNNFLKTGQPNWDDILQPNWDEILEDEA